MPNNNILPKTSFIHFKSDDELIGLAHTLQESIGLESFSASDLFLKEAVISELERRSFVVTEVLKIVHSEQIVSKKGNNQDKGVSESLGK